MVRGSSAPLSPAPRADWRRRPLTPEAVDALQPEGIARLQDEAIARTVAYAAERSPFYRELFRSAGLKPQAIRSAADLRRLPFTTKADISERGRAFWAADEGQIVDIPTTSGTTGQPTLFPLTESDVARLGYNEYLSFRAAGLTARDVVLLAVTMDKCFMAGLAYFEGLRRLGAATVRVGSGSPVMLLGFLERIRPTAIVSVPSFMKRVAQYAREKGADLTAASVRRLICIGEPVRENNLELNLLGRSISEAWGASCHSTYAATEIATSFCECTACCGGHLLPELLHVEIVDEAGHPVPDGQVGEVVATPLDVEGMPLLRFRVGDCAYLLRERCACGRWTPRLSPIYGRKNQMMKIKGTTVYPAAVQKSLAAVPAVIDYVMVVTAPTVLSDELEVIVAAHGDPDAVSRQVKEQLQGDLKVTPGVRIASIEEVARLQEGEGLRKKRLFIDKRGTAVTHA